MIKDSENSELAVHKKSKLIGTMYVASLSEGKQHSR